MTLQGSPSSFIVAKPFTTKAGSDVGHVMLPVVSSKLGLPHENGADPHGRAISCPNDCPRSPSDFPTSIIAILFKRHLLKQFPRWF